MRYLSDPIDLNITKSSWDWFLDQNYERLPALYRLLLMFQLVRARSTFKYFKIFLKNLNFRIEYQNLIQTFVILFYILHFTGCFWYGASKMKGNDTEKDSWIISNDLEGTSMFIRYIASLYWATVTCTTVGYGDILPKNKWELFWAILIILVGVAIFSYILSDLSSKFSEITKASTINQERMQ